MSPAAFRYFLASYMRIALEEPGSDDAAVEAALLALVPPRYRPEIDELARRERARAAAADPGLDAERPRRWSGGGVARESRRQVRRRHPDLDPRGPPVASPAV